MYSITEIESRWNMNNGQPYHYAWIGDWAINEDVTVQGTDTEQLTAVWDGDQYGFDDIEPDNIFVVATIFDDSTQDTDDTTAAFFGESSPPANPETPEGPTEGEVGTEYTFTTSTTDPENDKVYYQWYWGEELGDWEGPYTSGETAQFTHTFDVGGDLEVKVRAKDEWDTIGNYSEALMVEMSGPNIEIGDIKGGLLGISAEIENIGDMDAEDVEWSLTVTGGILDRIDIDMDSTISTLDADDKEVKKTSRPIFGFGDITIRVSASSETYGGSAFKAVDGKVLLFLVTVDSN